MVMGGGLRGWVRGQPCPLAKPPTLVGKAKKKKWEKGEKREKNKTTQKRNLGIQGELFGAFKEAEQTKKKKIQEGAPCIPWVRRCW